MIRLAGAWGVPTLEGGRLLHVDGCEYPVPQNAQVKIVDAGRFEIAHVRVGIRVFVFCRLGQLVEDDAEARARALPSAWSDLNAYLVR